MEPTPISRLLFKATGHVTLEHVKQVYGEKTIGMSDEELQDLLSEVIKAKKTATRFGHHTIVTMIVAYAKKAGYDVSSWADLLDLFKTNGSKPFVADLWQACYGQFDDVPGWEVTLENEWMQKESLVYLDLVDAKGRVPKGCYAALFSVCKNDKIKQMNRAGKSTHGGYIKLQRAKEEITEETRGRKRTKGTTLGSFAVLGGENEFNPDEEIKKKMRADNAERVSVSIWLYVNFDMHV